jgi:hypothetical protein
MLGAPVLIEPKPCFGYLQIDLRNSDGRKLVYLHRVVLEAFVGPCPRAHVACHFPDKRRRVNAADNLRWDTKAENALDRTAHRGGAAAVAERLLLLRQRAPHLRESCGDVPIGPDADASELKRMHDHWLARRRAA